MLGEIIDLTLGLNLAIHLCCLWQNELRTTPWSLFTPLAFTDCRTAQLRAASIFIAKMLLSAFV